MVFYLIFTAVSTLIGFLILIYTLNFTSPTTQEGRLISVNLFYFFTSSFLCLAGSVTLVLYWVGNLRLKKKRVADLESIHKPRIVFWRSLRHGILFSTAVLGVALLNTLKFANPLNMILLISAVVLIEIYFFGH